MTYLSLATLAKTDAAAIESALGQRGEDDIEDSYIISDADGEVIGSILGDADDSSDDDDIYTETVIDDSYSEYDNDDYDM